LLLLIGCNTNTQPTATITPAALTANQSTQPTAETSSTQTNTDVVEQPTTTPSLVLLTPIPTLTFAPVVGTPDPNRQRPTQIPFTPPAGATITPSGTLFRMPDLGNDTQIDFASLFADPPPTIGGIPALFSVDAFETRILLEPSPNNRYVIRVAIYLDAHAAYVAYLAYITRLLTEGQDVAIGDSAVVDELNSAYAAAMRFRNIFVTVERIPVTFGEPTPPRLSNTQLTAILSIFSRY
jgi:hypothetical protein